MNKFFINSYSLRKYADEGAVNYGADPRIAQIEQARANIPAPNAGTRAAGYNSMADITQDFKNSQGGPGMFTFDKMTAPLAYMGGVARPVSNQIMKGGQFLGDMASDAYGAYSDAAKGATDRIIDGGANLVRDAKIGMNNLAGKARRGAYSAVDAAGNGLAYAGGVTRPIAQKIEQTGRNMGDAVYDAYQRGVDAVGNTANAYDTGLRNATDRAIDGGANMVRNAKTGANNLMGKARRGAYNALDQGLGAAEAVGQSVRNAYGTYSNAVANATDRAIDGGSRMVRDAKIGMNNLAGKARRGAFNALDQGLGAAEAVGQSVRDAGSAVANKARAGYNKVKGWGSRLGGWLKRQHDRGMRAVRDTSYTGN